MAKLRVLIIVLIAIVGGFLIAAQFLASGGGKIAASDAEPVEVAEVSDTDDAGFWSKLTSSFRKSEPELPTAHRDLGRLGRHFRAAPEK